MIQNHVVAIGLD